MKTLKKLVDDFEKAIRDHAHARALDNTTDCGELRAVQVARLALTEALEDFAPKTWTREGGNRLKMFGELEVDSRGVIYFHSLTTGTSILRIAGLPNKLSDEMDPEALGVQLDITLSGGANDDPRYGAHVVLPNRKVRKALVKAFKPQVEELESPDPYDAQ